MLVEIANQTAQRGEAISVCVTRENLALAGQLELGIPVRALKRQGTFDLEGIWNFKAYVREERPEILQAHGRSTFSFLAFLKTLGRFQRRLSCTIITAASKSMHQFRLGSAGGGGTGLTVSWGSMLSWASGPSGPGCQRRRYG